MEEKLVAEKNLKYRGRALKPGDEFMARRADARVLRAIGKASTPTPPKKAKATTLKDKPTEQSIVDKKANEPPRGVVGPMTTETMPGTYDRRDLQAKD